MESSTPKALKAEAQSRPQVAAAIIEIGRMRGAPADEAVELTPDFARRAAVMIADQDWESARRLLVAGIRKYPDYPTGYQILGDLYSAVKQPISAAFAYHEALKRNPDNPVVLLRLAELARQADDLAGALRHLQQALALEPQSPTLAAKITELSSLLKGSASAVPDFLQTETAADLYKSHGYPERARAIYSQLLARTPGNDTLFDKLRQCG